MARYYDAILTVLPDEEATAEAYQDAYEDADVAADVEDDVYHDTAAVEEEGGVDG